MSKNLVKQYENDQIDEKNEEIRDIYEKQIAYEIDAEYGGYANEEDIEHHISESKLDGYMLYMKMKKDLNEM
jgi:hypothetical protein